MTLKFKIFLIALILSLPFWWGMNLLEAELKDFFFWQEISQNPQIFTAQITLEEKLRSLRPIRDKNVEDLKVEGESIISVFLSNEGNEKILFEKNINQELPIASLTKLMTALVILENYDLAKEIKISKRAIDQREDFGKLEEGKTFQVKYLLYPLLLESSNDAAFALANDYNGMTEEKFIELMNLEAQKISLKNTYFADSTGLDPKKPNKEINYSTAMDLIKLSKELLKKPLIWEILSTPKFSGYGPELINTNELLFDSSISWRPQIIGGKTGETPQAKGCLLLVLRAPKNKGYLINVILGTSDRFGEMKKLVDWLNSAYKW